MTTHRYCLLGLPRIGSQYIAELISQTTGAVHLGEPFTVSTAYPKTIVSKNNLLIAKGAIINFDSTEHQIEYVFDCFNNSKIDQPLVVRLFLIEMLEPYIPNIIERLNNLNFKFISIQRENVEYHLLSYLIARHTKKWNTDHNNGEPYSKDTKIEIKSYNDAKWLYDRRISFDNTIQNLNITYNTVRYEHAVEDLEQILNIPINTSIKFKKLILGDPYELISNHTEVKQFLETFL
jgi:beta-galactosidase GanA